MPLDIAALYRRYGDMVLGRCRSFLGNEADAQDACQEVFLRAHRHRRAFRGEAAPSTWLFRVTTTVCLNRLRSRRRRPEDPVAAPPEAFADSPLDAHVARDLVRRVLGEADARTRACVVHHYVDGMTHREVGELLGISAAAVRKRIGVFRRRLERDPPPWLAELRDA